MATQLQLRRGTAASWATANPTLATGEIGLVVDDDDVVVSMKIGDGSTAWATLPYKIPFLGADATNSAVDATDETLVLKQGVAQTGNILSIEDESGVAKVTAKIDEAGAGDAVVDVDGTLDVTGVTKLAGGYTSTGVTVGNTGNVSAAGNLTVDGTLDVTGATTLVGGYGSTGVSVSESGNIRTNGTLIVDGVSTLTGVVTAAGNVTAGGDLDVTGDLDVDGTTDLDGLTVAEPGITVSGGGVTVAGASSFSGNVDTTSGLDVTGGSLTVGGSSFTASTSGVVTSGRITSTGNVISSGGSINGNADDITTNTNAIAGIVGVTELTATGSNIGTVKIAAEQDLATGRTPNQIFGVSSGTWLVIAIALEDATGNVGTPKVTLTTYNTSTAYAGSFNFIGIRLS